MRCRNVVVEGKIGVECLNTAVDFCRQENDRDRQLAFLTSWTPRQDISLSFDNTTSN